MNEIIKRMKGKIFLWLKEPKNIVLCAILLAVGVYGIIEGNLIIIIVVYLGVFIFGNLIGWLLYLKNRFFN
jgi:hypothetical protein